MSESTSRSKAAIASAVGLAGNTLIASVQAIVMVPLYTRRLGQHLYGAWLGSGDVLVWLSMFDLGIPNLLIQKIGAAHAEGDEKKIGQWFGSGMAIMLPFAVLTALAGWILAGFLPGWLIPLDAKAATLTGAFRVGVLASSLVLAQTAFVAYCRGTQRTQKLTVGILVGSALAFASTLVLLLMGAGLYAISGGLLVRIIIQLGFNAVQILDEKKKNIFPPLSMEKPMLSEIGRTVPITAIGGLATTLTGYSEIFLVGLTLGPSASAIYALTRRAIDVARGIVDSATSATYGAFAHILSSPEAHRAPEVSIEVRAIRATLASSMVCGYLAVNASLVPIWAGHENFGGVWLTTALGAQMLALGAGVLVNSMIRATGKIALGSWVAVAETATRIPLVFFVAKTFGLLAVPIASTVVAIVFNVITTLLLRRNFAERNFSSPFAVAPVAWGVRGFLLVIAGTIGALVHHPSWSFVLAVGFTVTVVALAAQIAADPYTGRLRKMLIGRFSKLRPTKPA